VFRKKVEKTFKIMQLVILLVLIVFSWFGLYADVLDGLVGRWDFDDGTGKDLSGNGNDAMLQGTRIYSLGKGKACIELMPDTGPMIIPASENSPLAISRGTISLWLNVGWSQTTCLEYNNNAVQFRVYRGHLQVRFTGEHNFKYWNLVLDYDWPKYDMREWAFYPHERAVVGESEWHHFAVAYDDQGKRIIGWRDGQLIAVIDLSTTNMEPLRRKGLTAITTGKGFVGFMDDVRIYNRVLSDREIREIFNSTRSIYAGREDTNPNERKMDVYQYQEQDRTLYRAWLQYNPLPKRPGENLLKRIIVEDSNSTVQTAAAELAEALKSMYEFKPKIEEKPTEGSKVILGTPETSNWIRERADELKLDRIKYDGFIIKSLTNDNETTLVVVANVPAGVIFGTFDLIRRLQLGQDPCALDVLENPQIPIRMVNHWSYFRGFKYDNWYSGRYNSIYSWEDLRTGNTKLIRDWVRMMASAGWNAICPSEINWSARDNFLEHLDEVEVLASILRDYGMKLYWSPSYLLALKQETADKLYERVPDFGGYLMKLGSEGQNGDPRPPMVNRIAKTLLPYGGKCLVRTFVYGNYRYTPKPYRNLIPYDIFTPEDGKFLENVVLISKGSPMDWDFWAPIPALDGAIQKNLSGSELVIDKGWPVTWVEKWKWWLEQDNYRNGPGSLNKFDVDCILGVSMISPSPAWTKCPLNMVNYYGLGRLAWNPDRSVDEIYTEWIKQTFGNDPEVLRTIKTILFIADDVTRKLYTYRGYRGIWIDKGDIGMVEHKTPYVINRDGIGPVSPELQQRILDQYAPGLREVYGDSMRGEEFLTYFHFVDHNYRLSIGRTLIEDVYGNMDEAVQLAQQMVDLWEKLKDKIENRRFEYTKKILVDYVKDARNNRDGMVASFEEHTGRKRNDVIASLTPERLSAVGTYNVRHFGAVADGITNDAPAINKAIEACSAAGGGTVFVPMGIYATGSIHLKSNVTLALDAGAVLKALPDVMDLWEPNSNDRGLMDPAYYHWHASLIWGENLENVKIYGPGTLDGSALTRSSKVPKGTGDKCIALKLCQNVEIRNLNIQQGGHYAILATGCEDVVIDNVTINTSRDGLNLSGCRNVVVSNCHIDAVRYHDGYPAGGDDAIKLGSDLSLGKALPSENIIVRNCYLASGCNGLQIGTETIAPFRNIRFENIRIRRAGKAGIGITSNDGSVIENIHYRNIKMEKTFAPIFIKLSDVARVPKGMYKRGAIRNVTFENITATDCYSYFKGREMPSVIWGKPGSPIENIQFRNVSITAKGGHPVTEAEVEPPENDERFPRKLGPIPAYAWYLRHVKNISFIGCEFLFEKSDGRPAIVLDDAMNILFEDTLLPIGSECSSRIAIRRQTKNLIIRNCKGMADREITASNSYY